MGTVKFYIYLCIFSKSIFSKEAAVAVGAEKLSEWEEEQLGPDGSEGAAPAGKAADTEGKTTANLGSLVNVFKKPFIVRGQDRKGWEEEALIFELFGQSSMEVETGNAYQPTVRSVSLFFSFAVLVKPYNVMAYI